MTATIVLLALISIVFVGYVDRFSLTNLFLGVVSYFTVETIAII